MLVISTVYISYSSPPVLTESPPSVSPISIPLNPTSAAYKHVCRVIHCTYKLVCSFIGRVGNHQYPPPPKDREPPFRNGHQLPLAPQLGVGHWEYPIHTGTLNS